MHINAQKSTRIDAITSVSFSIARIGEKLQADQELDNEVDKFAVKVVKNNEIVGHVPREYSQILWYFIAHGGKICVKVTSRSHVTANSFVEEWGFLVS